MPELLNKMIQTGLTVESVFIPFSQSRNKDSKHKSLNWLVRVLYRGKIVLTTEYSQGEGWCPCYKLAAKFKKNSYLFRSAVEMECELGKVCMASMLGDMCYSTTKRITLDPCGPIASLFMDAQAINCCNFQDWCDELGENSDSISAKRVYDTCLQTGLALLNTVGRELFDEFTCLAREF
jgi:hypothetical protein